MGYDMVRLMERLPTGKAPGLGLPPEFETVNNITAAPARGWGRFAGCATALIRTERGGDSVTGLANAIGNEGSM